jgi:SAM-dependent methyltransferase
VIRESTSASVLPIGRPRRVAYGDFQTPPALAEAVCRTLADERPATIIEPTCGTGTFLAAALRRFPTALRVVGMDINPRHLAEARRAVANVAPAECEFRIADFFQTDWPSVLSQCAEPILIIGNPPWVTSAALGRLASGNRPRKENRRGLSGLDALTGKSNFDVSEWMIVRLLEAAAGRRMTLAMLCKTAVAQKVLAHAWKSRLPVEHSEVRRIDAAKSFGARVDACLLVCRLGVGSAAGECRVFDDLSGRRSDRAFGLRGGRLVADVSAYDRVRHLVGSGLRWRSGVKHDCAAVFEFRREGLAWRNGLGDKIDIEPDCVFPLLKSSQVAAGDVANPRRNVLVPQRHVGEETCSLATRAPQTWRYLLQHGERLDRRASSVYRNQPRFSIFGVGPYTFCKWKVMVSGFYKSWRFVAVGPVEDRPVLCDDTCYFLPCDSAAEARQRADLLNSDRAQEFFSAFVFNESKRPLTAEILSSVDLEALAAELTAGCRRVPVPREHETPLPNPGAPKRLQSRMSKNRAR